MERFRYTDDRWRGEVLKLVWKLLNKFQHLTKYYSDGLSGGLDQLREIREGTYEDLNIFCHAIAIIEAHTLLVKERPKYNGLDWYWHPAQTSKQGEADLVGKRRSKTIVSVEVTTSQKPEGTTAKRVRKTLKTLAEMEGVKFFAVAGESMEVFAKNCIDQEGYDIEVLNLRLREFSSESKGILHKQL